MMSLITLNRHKIKKIIIIAILKSETMGKAKLMNRTPGSRLLASSLPGSALKTQIESLGKPPDVNKQSQSLARKLDIKRHSPSILYEH